MKHKKSGNGTCLYTAMCLAAAMEYDDELKFRPLSASGRGISSNEHRSYEADAWWKKARTRFGLVVQETEEVEGEPEDEEHDFDFDVDIDHTAADTRLQVTKLLLEGCDFDEGEVFERVGVAADSRYRRLVGPELEDRYGPIDDYRLRHSEILASGTCHAGTIVLTSAIVRFEGTVTTRSEGRTEIEVADAYPYANAVKKHLVVFRCHQENIAGRELDIDDVELVSAKALEAVSFAGADDWNALHVGAKLIELARRHKLPRHVVDGMEMRLFTRADPTADPSHWSAHYDPTAPRDNPGIRAHRVSRRALEPELRAVRQRRHALGWDVFRETSAPRPATRRKPAHWLIAMPPRPRPARRPAARYARPRRAR